MRGMHSLWLFTRGFARGATWSLIVAVPFAVFVAWILLKSSSYPQVDHLTDEAGGAYSVRDIPRYGLGGMVYSAVLIVLPWATVCGFVRCVRRSSERGKVTGTVSG